MCFRGVRNTLSSFLTSVSTIWCLYVGNPEIALPGKRDATVTQRDGNLIVALQPAGRPSRSGRHAPTVTLRSYPPPLGGWWWGRVFSEVSRYAEFIFDIRFVRRRLYVG